MAVTETQKIIFSMVGVGKVHKPNRTVLHDIYLSFFYGAKIGVLGLNGSGKSTLMKIIAGLDEDYIGEITKVKGVTFGYLSQEPELDPNKTVREVVEEGAAELVALVKEYNGISEKFAEPARIPERRVVYDEPEVVPDELPIEPLPEHRCGEQPKEG